MDSEILTFCADNPSIASYKEFVEQFRKKLTYSTILKYNLPLLPTEAEVAGKIYYKVALSYTGTVVTLALNVVNLNLLAFQFEKNSYFFDNTYTEDLKDKLFPGTDHVIMGFSNTYESLGDRVAVNLGKSPMQHALRALMSYKSSSASVIKTSLITVIEMVCEAVRFKIIEDRVTNNFFTPNYEDLWVELSEQIQKADKEGNILVPVALDNGDGTIINIDKVSQVIASMGILKKFPA